jgi:hypothetical protein
MDMMICGIEATFGHKKKVSSPATKQGGHVKVKCVEMLE